MGQHSNDVGVDIAKANSTLSEAQLLALQRRGEQTPSRELEVLVNAVQCAR